MISDLYLVLLLSLGETETKTPQDKQQAVELASGKIHLLFHHVWECTAGMGIFRKIFKQEIYFLLQGWVNHKAMFSWH